jgi:uncharacterized protein (TIGR00369 family)
MVDLDTLSAEIQNGLIADQGIMDTFGLEMLTIDQGVCEINCDVPGALINAKGFAHGSIAFAVMDTACAYALRSVGVSGVTIHGDTHFVRGAGAGDRLFARVEIVSRSRRVATLRGETFLVGTDGERQLSAHGSFVFQLRG